MLGKPEVFAKSYYEAGADELMYMDVVASLYERNSLHDIISRTARETFIPLTVGGGLRTIEDMRAVLRAGADKICINTAAIKAPGIIAEASRVLGCSTVVVGIEAIRQPTGAYLAYTDNGRNSTGVEVVSWAKQVENLGAGEIVLTSVDREGTGQGLDIDLIRKVAGEVNVPVVAHGGVGGPEHVSAALRNGGADAVAIASVLHYGLVQQNRSLLGYEVEGNIEFLKSGREFSRIAGLTVREIKDHLQAEGIACRPSPEPT